LGGGFWLLVLILILILLLIRMNYRLHGGD